MKTPSSTSAKKPVKRKVVCAQKTTKKPRVKVTLESAQNLIVSDNDTAAIDAVARATANSLVSARGSHKRSAVERLGDPNPADPESSLVERVSNAIERELSKIETIIGVSHVPPVLRTEAESRARVLASLARTLKEVMRLREQERDANEEKTRAADDAIPEISTSFDPNSRDAWRSLSAKQRAYILTQLNERELGDINANWKLFAHDHQVPPPRAPNGAPWLTWLLIGGRGAGKTRAGAEWVRAQALGLAPFPDEPTTNIALVGELTAECAGLWIILLHGFWIKDLTAINTMIGATGLLVSYWGFRFGVLGVYVSGRTREKMSLMTGQDTPSVLGSLINKVVKKK